LKHYLQVTATDFERAAEATREQADQTRQQEWCRIKHDGFARVASVAGGRSPENDTLPYDTNDNYGGTPANNQPAQNAYVSGIGVGSNGDPSGFLMTPGNGAIVASQVKLGNAIQTTSGLPTDIAFVGITVDLSKLPVHGQGRKRSDGLI
jgi:hypothetical protein